MMAPTAFDDPDEREIDDVDAVLGDEAAAWPDDYDQTGEDED